MLDGRIYRSGLFVVVVAVIVLAFSLGSQAPPLEATLVPDAFNGPGAYATMRSLAAQYPNRRPGSAGDEQLAGHVAQALSADGLLVKRRQSAARTIDGTRTIETVTGTLAGATPGAIVVVAHRDSARSGAAAELSGTAVLLELAHILSAQTQQRSVVLASTSAQVGAAGAAKLAQALPAPVDAVIVLGDMAGTELRPPLVVPWSDRQLLAPPLLRNTAAAALSEQANVSAGEEGVGGQFLHLAFGLAASEQRPFADLGQPAVLVSTSGARLPAPEEPTSASQITSFGRAVLQTVTALEAAPNLPPPSTYLRWRGKLIPAWAISVLVLALIVPVLIATIDGLARVRRRGYRVARWAGWVLSACLPFAIATLAVVGLRATGAINAAPPGPVGGDALVMSGRATAILAALSCLIVAGFALRWRLGRRAWATQSAAPGASTSRARTRQPAPGDAASPGAAAAFMLVLCAVALAIWVANPFAAALLVPALHLWLWIVGPEERPRAAWAALLFAAGLVPAMLAAYYYAATLGLGPAPATWNAVLMLAGGDVGVMAALEWSIVLGCVVSLGVMIVRIARQPRPADAPATVRGPITYAGPGSLGGTKSALRR